MTAREFVAEAIFAQVRVARDYVAKYGFRNHWYPVMFASELADGQARALTLRGENILLKRTDGVIHGLRVSGLHRGVALSRKLKCYTKNTVVRSFLANGNI